ncbi:MAG: glucosidase family protein [Armatimonadota bacterium]
MLKILVIAILLINLGGQMVHAKSDTFNGKFVSGKGDVDCIQALDTSLRMFHEDAEFPNISMMYTPWWNGLYEGASWDAWWIQNSYGTSYCAIPFLQEPYLTFLQNANDLWFDQIGDGKRVGMNNIVAPDGCLCDAARPGNIHYKQGDGMVEKHDYAMEFTAAGIVIQGELLLVRRDMDSIRHYLPLLERSETFLFSRLDPVNDLFLIGLSGNLLGPSWTGTQYPDGTLDMGYLSGMSITYTAALDRLIELEKMVGNTEKAKLYETRRYRVRKALGKLMTDEGYFVKGIDKLGAKHGVYGAEKYGYFESSVNHDAVAFGVVDDAQSKKIIDKMASIPGLRPHNLIISNYPALDDMIDFDFGFGEWVNGGHWSTCEARMIMAYYRVGRHNDARASMNQIMKFFNDYRIDNPLPGFGSRVWFGDRITTVIYDGFGIPAALIRGLYQPVYYADRMTLTPSIPDGIESLKQNIPLRFGKKQIMVSMTRSRSETPGVTVDGKNWQYLDGKTVTLPYDEIPDVCKVEFVLPEVDQKASADTKYQPIKEISTPDVSGISDEFDKQYTSLKAALKTVKSMKGDLEFEAAFIKSAIDAVDAYRIRVRNNNAGKYSSFNEQKRAAIIELYKKAAEDLFTGLQNYLNGPEVTGDPSKSALSKVLL